MKKRIRKKKYKQSLVTCIKCKTQTEWYRHEDDGYYCPSCYADLVGISVSEVWGSII